MLIRSSIYEFGEFMMISRIGLLMAVDYKDLT
jgi:hypothetical protein